ncbi:MAG: response regulator [Desulfovibrionales bacterium]
MSEILVVTSRPEEMSDFTRTLSKDGRKVTLAGSGMKALEILRSTPPDMVVADERLPDMSGLDLVRRILLINAMINTAVVSGLPSDEFHEVSEGLGVLVQLPMQPGSAGAEEILSKLAQFS